MTPLVAAVIGLLLGALIGFLAGWQAAERAYVPIFGRDEFDDETESDSE